MSLLLAFQGTPPAEPDYIIEVLSEIPEELIEDFGFELSSLIEDVPVEDLIFFLESELSDDVSEEEGQIEYFIEDDLISSLEAAEEEELIVPDGWEYVTYSTFDSEPPIIVVTERYNLPFIVTPGRLRSF
jgi:hypothetical protein